MSKTVYTVLALNFDSKKEVLGLYLSENEEANCWLCSESQNQDTFVALSIDFHTHRAHNLRSKLGLNRLL